MADSYLDNLLANGEALLIETRQHWIAAIRYVLRPILILLIAAGLVLLSSWLGWNDGILGTLNDLILWGAGILFIVSIIWLPIDLVRWASRKYVLTSRRVMRMDGVLRKRSFDSSLEQINDIRTEQSFVGRTLNYADLTIYTASDTANEVYAQLLDGLQFKKAVLEAKEAIRTGTLLTALPDDFIVKGGTNEASRRADGKIKEPAAGEAGVASAEEGATGAAGGVSAAAVVAASTVIEPSGEMPAAIEVAPVAVAEPVAVAPVAVAPVAAPALVVEPVAEAAPVAEAVAEVVEPVEEMVAEAEAVAEPMAEAVVKAPEVVAEVVDDAIDSEADEVKPA
ncbi:MAG TPA: PH domain-containing protein [Candidatus Deferrimicrobium sp.]|nr:PH domain-containing protein [Candidatus Deferrimicrobium sp.]